MSRIFIEGLKLQGKHGVYDEERNTAQTFIIDISIDADSLKAETSDDIKDAIDYCKIAEATRECVENNSYKLIERLGAAIADSILKDTRIEKVSVTVRKPAALKNGMGGVTITHTQKVS